MVYIPPIAVRTVKSSLLHPSPPVIGRAGRRVGSILYGLRSMLSIYGIYAVTQLASHFTVWSMFLKGDFWKFLSTLFNTASSAAFTFLCVGGCWDRTFATLVVAIWPPNPSLCYVLIQYTVTTGSFFSVEKFLLYSLLLCRVIFLETVAGVPGFAGGMIRHLQCLRRMERDQARPPIYPI